MTGPSRNVIVAFDPADPRWFPVDLHVRGGRYGFLRIEDNVLERSSFLDTRIEAPLAEAMPIDAMGLDAGPIEQVPAWLFHTSFCGSTLLARALHLPPHHVCLKEPLVLRRLADAQHAGLPLGGLIDSTARLLARPWHPHGSVVIKPTHVALSIAGSLLAATPGSRGIVLTSRLDDFLISNLKKTTESQARIPELVERTMRASGMLGKLPAAALEPPDLLCAAGLQWAAQRELMHDLVEEYGGRVRVMDMQTLLRDFSEAVLSCAHWLRLRAPDGELATHAAQIATRNAKSIDIPYGPAHREHESALVAGVYEAPLAHAKQWLDAYVIPAMRPAAAADPVSWTFP